MSVTDKHGYERHSTDLQQRLAWNVRDIRHAMSLTVEAAAQRAHLHWRHFQKIEAGEVNVTLKTLVKIASAFEVDPHDLLASERLPVKKKPVREQKRRR